MSMNDSGGGDATTTNDTNTTNSFTNATNSNTNSSTESRTAATTATRIHLDVVPPPPPPSTRITAPVATGTIPTTTTTDALVVMMLDAPVVVVDSASAAVVASSSSSSSVVTCELCQEQFTSRNLLFQHLRGGGDDNGDTPSSSSNHQNNNDKKKKKKRQKQSKTGATNNHRVSICPKITQQQHLETTTTTADNCRDTNKNNEPNDNENDRTTITAVAVAVAETVSSSSSSSLSHVSTLPTSTNTTTTKIPLPPSIAKKQQRQLVWANEQLLRQRRRRRQQGQKFTITAPKTTLPVIGTTTTTTSTTTTSTATDSAAAADTSLSVKARSVAVSVNDDNNACNRSTSRTTNNNNSVDNTTTTMTSSNLLWIGDLPLLWTTPKKNYQRLRMLLRSHIPRTIPTPHIKLVHRKAYRHRRSRPLNNYNNTISHDTNIDTTTTTTTNIVAAIQPFTTETIGTTTDPSRGDDNHDVNLSTTDTTTITTATVNINNSTAMDMDDDRLPSLLQQQQSAVVMATNDRINNDATNSIDQTQQQQHPYLGYAILVFRDHEECNIVLRELDQREITLTSVFGTCITDDIQQNKDFYQLLQQQGNDDENHNETTFRIKVRPVDDHHTVPKHQLTTGTAGGTSNRRASIDDEGAYDPSNINNNSTTTGRTAIAVVAAAIAGTDPSLMDRLRPLATDVLLERIQSLGFGDGGVERSRVTAETILLPTTSNHNVSSQQQHQQSIMNILQEQHDRTLDLAVRAYEGKSPKIVHHEGIRIPDSMRDKLLQLLRNVRWAVPNHRNGMNTERYLVLLSNVQNDVFYNELRVACKELMTYVTATTNNDSTESSYYYSGIAITKNFVGSPHIDDRDQTYQYAISLGNFTYGGELCIDGGIAQVVVAENHDAPNATTTTITAVPVIHVVNTHNRIARVDGRHVHWVRTWDNQTTTDIVDGSAKNSVNTRTDPSIDDNGDNDIVGKTDCDRYSLIFYDTSQRRPTPVVDMMDDFSVV